MGRHQVACCFWCFGAADVLSGLGDDRVRGGPTVLAAARIAHIPRGALPSVPRWLWFIIALGGCHGGAGRWWSGDLDGWSSTSDSAERCNFSCALTALSDRPPRVGRSHVLDHERRRNRTRARDFGPPLSGWLRIPVDEWAVALSLALRAFPMLIDEFQVLYAARRLRPKRIPRSRKARRWRHALRVDRPARCCDHRDAAARRRNGGRDHRPRRHRPVVCQSGPAETCGLG